MNLIVGPTLLAKLLLMALAATAIVYAGIGARLANDVRTEVDGLPVQSFEDLDESNSESQTVRFRHSDPQHQRMPCLLCHQRTDNSPRIKRGGHSPCSGCHVEQFAQTSGPLCTICHSDSGVRAFPALRSFNAKFDHGRHLRQTNCSTCHKPTRNGVALSIPKGSAAHSTCFTCHGPQTTIAGKNIGSCDTCHSPGRLARTSEWAKAFSMNFNHSEHGRGRQSCTTCHTVRAGVSRSRQVTSPLASMHFASAKAQSCASCHNGKKAFGANDFKNCKRCHEGSTFKF